MGYKNINDKRKAAREWKQRNKAYALEVERKRVARRRAIIRRYKSMLSCCHCGMSFKEHPECCDFHHVDPSIKEALISRMLSKSWERLKAEVFKCKPLCANCHRIEHYKNK